VGYVCPYCATYTAQLAARHDEVVDLGARVLLVYPSEEDDPDVRRRFVDAVEGLLASDGRTMNEAFQDTWRTATSMFESSPIASEQIVVRKLEASDPEGMSEILPAAGSLMRFHPVYSGRYPVPDPADASRERIEVLTPMKFSAYKKTGPNNAGKEGEERERARIPAVVIVRYVQDERGSGWSPYASFIFFSPEATEYRIGIPIF